MSVDPVYWTGAWRIHAGLAQARADAKWCVVRGRKPKPRLTDPKDAPQRLAKRRSALVYYLCSRDATYRCENWA